MPRIPDREFEKRLRVTEQMLSSGHYPHQIKRQLSQQYQVDRRTVDRWIHVARARMQRESGVTRVDHKARIGAGLREITRQLANIAIDQKASRGEKINALRALERTLENEKKLYGLNEPEEMRITGADPVSDVFVDDPKLAEELERERRKIVGCKTFDVVEKDDPQLPARSNGVRDTNTGGAGSNGNGSTIHSSS